MRSTWALGGADSTVRSSEFIRSILSLIAARTALSLSLPLLRQCYETCCEGLVWIDKVRIYMVLLEV